MFLIRLCQLLIIIVLMPFFVFNFLTFGLNNETGTDEKKSISVVMVLGAGLSDNKTPSIILAQRLDAAAKIYFDQKLSYLILSGTNTSIYYNEPESMKKYLEKVWGIDEKNLVLDYGGRRTIDSCWRLKNVFKIDKVYLSTQAYHLGRATTLCRNIGITTVPIIAKDNQRYGVERNGLIREIGASWEAVFNLYNKYEPEIKSDGTEAEI
jgi:SanA protein